MDHIIPRAVVPELDCVVANLEFETNPKSPLYPRPFLGLVGLVAPSRAVYIDFVYHRLAA